MLYEVNETYLKLKQQLLAKQQRQKAALQLTENQLKVIEHLETKTTGLGSLAARVRQADVR